MFKNAVDGAKKTISYIFLAFRFAGQMYIVIFAYCHARFELGLSLFALVVMEAGRCGGRS
jgi:hypothetical protein